MRLIDADAIKRRVVIGGSEQCKKCALAEMLYDIVNAPTVEAEPIRHGRFIKTYYGVKCSVCEAHFTGRVFSTFGAGKYCANCGAKMDESEAKK